MTEPGAGAYVVPPEDKTTIRLPPLFGRGDEGGAGGGDRGHDDTGGAALDSTAGLSDEALAELWRKVPSVPTFEMIDSNSLREFEGTPVTGERVVVGGGEGA